MPIDKRLSEITPLDSPLKPSGSCKNQELSLFGKRMTSPEISPFSERMRHKKGTESPLKVKRSISKINSSCFGSHKPIIRMKTETDKANIQSLESTNESCSANEKKNDNL